MKREVNLSEEQILHLFDFVKSKYVRYIDVQHEIVDHLATAIEEEMENDESLDFDQALRIVYSRFPITGFAQFVGEKETAMTYYWWKRTFRYMIEYLTVPKVLVTIGLTLLLFIIISIFRSYGLAAILITGLVLSTLNFKKYSKIIKDINKTQNLLFVNCFLGATTGFTWFAFIPQFFFQSYRLNIAENIAQFRQFDGLSVATFVVSSMLAFMFLYWHASYYVFPVMLKEDVEKKYKHLNLGLDF